MCVVLSAMSEYGADSYIVRLVGVRSFYLGARGSSLILLRGVCVYMVCCCFFLPLTHTNTHIFIHSLRPVVSKSLVHLHCVISCFVSEPTLFVCWEVCGGDGWWWCWTKPFVEQPSLHLICFVLL